MEGLKKKKGYTNFEVSCCLETIIEQYRNSETFLTSAKNYSEDAHNDSEHEIQDRIELLSQLQEYIDHKQEDLLSEDPEEKSNNVRYSILDVLELDRKRIARDLHDSSVQLLTMLVHKAELCEKLIEIDTIRTKMELNMMGGFLKDAISELRQTIFDLRPMTMDDLGLMDSIERYIQMLIQESGIQFRITVINSENYNIEKILKPVEKLSLYRILQECCSNIIKHSEATKSLITLKIQSNALYMQVDDNGVGCRDKEKILKINKISDEIKNNHNKCLDVVTSMLSSRGDFSGYGLSMLCERVYLMNGVLNIQTGEDGTSVRVTIPISIKQEELYETH